MAPAALAGIATTPADAWNGRRAHGWQEDEPDEADRRHPLPGVLANRRLLLLGAALALFNLGNGGMLSLVGQLRHHGAVDDDPDGALGRVAGRRAVAPLPAADRLRRVPDARGPFGLCQLPVLADPGGGAGRHGFGLLGVAVPVLVADLAWGSGHTQTALGTVSALQGIDGALSGLFGDMLVDWLGWTAAFLGLAVPGVVASALALWLAKAAVDAEADAAPRLQDSQAG